MSEDADLVVPRDPSSERRSNVLALNKVRDALKSTAAVVGVSLPFPDGQHSERGAHRQWELVYESDLGRLMDDNYFCRATTTTSADQRPS